MYIILVACNSPQNNNSNEKGNSKVINSVSLNTEIKQEPSIECTRGKAEPIIDREVFPNTSFNLQSDGISGIESVNYGDGERLIIHNWGCEYYVLTFRFETTKFYHDTTDLAYWYRSAWRLTTNMLAGIDAPINIKRALVYLDSYILKKSRQNFKLAKLGEEIEFDGSELRQFITVDRIEKLTENKYAVIISFTRGPL